MNTFEEFFKRYACQHGGSATLIGPKAPLTVAIAEVLGSIVRKKTALDFARRVGQIVQGDRFIRKLSNKIGSPANHETEDEFVARATSVLRTMLYRKFGLGTDDNEAARQRQPV